MNPGALPQAIAKVAPLARNYSIVPLSGFIVHRLAPKARFNYSLGQRPRNTNRNTDPALKARFNTPSGYRFFVTHAPIRSSAFSIFSIEFATLKRKYPSPKSPKAVPESPATPASSSNASASFFEGQPVAVMFGKT